MPKKDGFEVLEALKGDPALKNIPVLVFSTLGQDSDVERAKNLGARDFVNNSDATLVDTLVEKDIISDENLGIMISDFLKMPFVSLSKISIPEEVFHIVPERIARKQKIIAFARDQNGIKVAMNNPLNKEIQDMITKKTGSKVIPYFSTERDISNTFDIYKKELQKN